MYSTTIVIEKIVYPGRALGRGEDGVATFTDNALPGETVEVLVYKSKKTFKEARTTRVVQVSEKRLNPRCPLFGACGGCSLQQVAYREQLEIKEGYVRELLAPLGAAVSPILPSAAEWGYRNKMEFSFFEENGVVCTGLHRKGAFDRYLAVPPCFIADPDFLACVDAVISFARASGLPVYNKKTHQGFYRHLVLRKGVRTGQVLVNLVTNTQEGITPSFFAPLVEVLAPRVQSIYWTRNSSLSDAVNADELMCLQGSAMIDEELQVGGRRYVFSISPFSFFQTNTLAAEQLYETVGSLLAPQPADRVLDLYCGTGTIGMTVAAGVREVIGIEQVPSSIENALLNKQKNMVQNISFVGSTVEQWAKDSGAQPCTAIIVDPPRNGLSGKVLAFIGSSGADKLVYVSCNPSTLARDLAILRDDAGYTIGQIIPLDMFPQTYHVEVVVSLHK